MSKLRVIYAILTLIIAIRVSCIRSNDGSSEGMIPDYFEYYYTNINQKINESMSISTCTIYGQSLSLESTFGGVSSPLNADMIVEIIPPPQAVLARWEPQNKGITKLKVFAQGNKNLCSSNKYIAFKKGLFKASKGCFRMFITNPRTNVRVKQNVIKRVGATLHPDHIRCDTTTSSQVCSINKQSNKSEIVQLPTHLSLLHEYPFIVKAKNVIVAKSGMLALPCGPFGLLASCEAVNWGVQTAASVVGRVEDCRKYYLTGSKDSFCPFRRYKRIFLMSQYDDTQIGQFMMESFPRLVYHLDYLRANPDVMIHFGFTKRESVPSFALPLIFINWLGLGDRLINGTYYADEVVMSREGGCQDAGYNAWEVISMRDRFISMLGLPTDAVLLSPSTLTKYRPSIVILTRSIGSRYVQNKSDGKTRGWPKGFVDKLVVILAKAFPSHTVELFSDQNASLMSSPSEQIKMFRKADIAIGFHGAGLSNTMYMKPGGVVVEVLPYFDSRHAPAVGIFPRLSALIGLHHFSFYTPGIDFTPQHLVDEMQNFYDKVNMWTHN